MTRKIGFPPLSKNRPSENVLERLPLHAEVPIEITGHGGGHYLRIPKPILEYFELRAGDIVRIRFVEVRRAMMEEE